MFLLKKLHTSLHGRYAVVTVSTIAAEVGLFALVVGIPGWTTWAAGVATCIAFAIAFFGHVHYTFGGNATTVQRQLSHLVMRLATLLLRNALYVILITRAGFDAWASYGTAFVIGVVSYVGTRWAAEGMTPRKQLTAFRRGIANLYHLCRPDFL